jgi:aminoglycoside phosphotransferase
MIGDAGACSGHVDLGARGVADRWADLAIATWSTQWNYGAGFRKDGQGAASAATFLRRGISTAEMQTS